MTPDAATAASEAVRLAGTDPIRAVVLGHQALADAGRDHDTASQAARALGLAAREAHDLQTSRRWFRTAVRRARAGHHANREAEALLGLSLTEAMAGRLSKALSILAEAAAIDGGPTGAIAAQKALLLSQGGRFAEAEDAYRIALDHARASSAKGDEAKLLNNRAILQCMRGDTVAAERDIRRAADLAVAAGNDYAAAAAAHALGWILGRRGDVPAALQALDDVEPEYERIGLGTEELLRDRVELLLAARLDREAVTAARSAVDELRTKGLGSDLAEALLLLAQAESAAGNHEQARQAAERARRSFRAGGRSAWAALARFAALQATVAVTPPSAKLVRTAQSVADELDATGWVLPALDAQLTAARLAFDRGDVVTGARAAGRAASARGRGPADLRARAWHAEALSRLGRGDRSGARRAIGRGLHLIDELRDAMGATELRAHVGGHGETLSELGLHLALEDGAPATILEWAERQRSQSLRFRPVRPSADPELVGALAELRNVVAAIDDAVLAGDDPARDRARHVQLERRVSALTRRAAAANPARDGRSSSGRIDVAGLRRQLDGVVLVEFVAAGSRLGAVVVDQRHTSYADVASTEEVTSLVDAVAFALRRLARAGIPASSRASARTSLATASTRLDELLTAPLRPMAPGRPVVIVPTGDLHRLAWASLPTFAVRPFAVAPSASIWSEIRTRPRTASGVVAAVAGPDLAAANGEVRAVAGHHRGARVLASSESQVDAVLEVIDGADIAHLATHGTFRADNPLFSSLSVADGPLFVHDLERLRAAPPTVVLSACDAAQSERATGDELLGMVAALFAMGTRAVVASVLPVPDEGTAALMDVFHREMATGQPAAIALWHAREHLLRTGDDTALATASAFAVYGDGLTSPRGPST